MAYDNNLALESDFTYETYQEQAPAVSQTTAPSGAAVTSLNGLGGPTVNLLGGSSGFSFTVGAPNLTLTSPLTTKGDLYVRNAAQGTRLAVGADDARLVADSGAATGLRWQAASTGWTASTGTATRTAFDTATATVTEVAERLKALVDDLMTQKILKA